MGGTTIVKDADSLLEGFRSIDNSIKEGLNMGLNPDTDITIIEKVKIKGKKKPVIRGIGSESIATAVMKVYQKEMKKRYKLMIHLGS